MRGVEGERVVRILDVVAIRVLPSQRVVNEPVPGVRPSITVRIQTAVTVNRRCSESIGTGIAAGTSDVVPVPVAVAVGLLGRVELEFVVVHTEHAVAVTVPVKVVPLCGFKRKVVGLVGIPVAVLVGASQQSQGAVASHGRATVAVGAERIVAVAVVVAVGPLGGVGWITVVFIAKAVKVYVQAPETVSR